MPFNTTTSRAKGKGKNPSAPVGRPKLAGRRRQTPAMVLDDSEPDTDDDSDVMDDLSEGGMNVANSNLVLHGVVKVFTVSAEPNFGQPWSMHPQDKSTGTGFIVSGRRILTNAHVVAYHSAVRVRKHSSSEKFVAKVLAIAHGSDIAILTVEDESFWEDATELELGNMPQLQQQVLVVGYPVGGDTISVTVGVVSRIDYDQYAHSSRENLVAQVDAAINPGNSGGPVLSDGKVVGVAFQGLDGADGIGYIIPIPVVKHALQDYERNKHITGSGRLPFAWQSTENMYMKKFYNLPRGVAGVRITNVLPMSLAFTVLKENDIVSSIDGRNVAEDGTIVWKGDVRVPMAGVYTDKFIGDTMPLTLYRNGKKHDVSLTVDDVPELVPTTLFESRPSYLVFGGLVFTPLTVPYLGSASCVPMRLIELTESEPEKPGDQVVLLADILSHPVNVGYDMGDVGSLPLASINGKHVRNLVEAARICQDTTEPFVRFEFEKSGVIILPTKEAREATIEVLKHNAIPAAMSDDLITTLGTVADSAVSVDTPTTAKGSATKRVTRGRGKKPVA